MKQLKMVCRFDGEGSDRCLVISISRAPATVVQCELYWSDGVNIHWWRRPVVQRMAEIWANLSICRGLRLFAVRDWTLIAYKLAPGQREELITLEDLTDELDKRCLQLCRGRSFIALSLVNQPTPKILEHSKADLEVLLSKARSIRSFTDATKDFLPCRWLYRHKPAEYFKDIEDHHGNVMKVYIKDNNGDPASPINSHLDGLFFSADVNPKTRRPKWRPIYGNLRLLISCRKLFEFASNLYFADVYCNTSAVHHVTLVMTRPGSLADEFCSEKLVLLSKTDRCQNPFLFLEGNKAFVSTRIMVEVLYTEDVDIGRCLQDKACDASLKKCCVKSYSKRHFGRAKNQNCPKCNLKTTLS